MEIKNIKIFSWILIGLTLVVTSCRDDTFSPYWDDNSDEYTVTLNIGLEAMNPVSRAEGDNGNSGNGSLTYDAGPAIASGSQIDMLVYAVYYDANQNPNNPKWEAATEYAKAESPFEEFEVGYGQTIVDVKDKFKNGGHHTMTLTLKKDYDYRVVFWAQNHETKAYVIDDLKKVQMKYKIEEMNSPEGSTGDDSDAEEETKEATSAQNIVSVNNDEKRDAFCRYVKLNAENTNKNITIWLRRPLAQINVGTRGFDFETITRNSDKKYLYSKVRINRAARYFNVVEDKVYTNTGQDDNYNGEEDTESFYTVDYEYNRIPAYWKWGEDSVPDYPSYTIYDLKNRSIENGVYSAYNTFISLHPEKLQGASTDEEKMTKFMQLYGKEEFLKVHLFDNGGGHKEHKEKLEGEGKNPPMYEETQEEGGYFSYCGMGVSGDEKFNNESEIFKYLSMAYVFVPTEQDGPSYTLDSFRMWLATDKEGHNEFEVLSLNHVPVQRNRRTNIVGSLLTAKADLQIIVDDDFGGNKISGDNVVSGEISEGFYYNAEKKEFQISSREGLLFFQRLVNGNVAVRQISQASTGVELKGKYPYKEYGTGNPMNLSYDPVRYEDLDPLKAQILLKGTGLIDYVYKGVDDYTTTFNGFTVHLALDDNKWPLYNNFSFLGCTVRLMADIDMSGIDWIPIGFDCCSWDNSTNDNNNEPYTAAVAQIGPINYRTIVKKGTKDVYLQYRRAFCGTFDGNNHTVYNIKTKKFGPEVLEYNRQKVDKGSGSAGPLDNLPWFGRGFFGLGGPGVVIKNLRLQNIEIHGNNGVAGIIAVVNSAGLEARIDNCVVDGGKITADPLYRYDTNPENSYQGRTHARGVYVAGIVGQFSAYGDNSGVTNCEVRNVTITGFRRMGGIIGSIADQGDSKMGNSDFQVDIIVEGNTVANSLILCNQFVPFNYVFNDEANNIWKNGYGWGTASAFAPMSAMVVGGLLDGIDAFESNFGYKQRETNPHTRNEFYNDYVGGYNTVNNVQYSILNVMENTTESKLQQKDPNTRRVAIVENIPLEHIPMFSSLFVDEVSLEDNYYGNSNLRTKITFQEDAQIWVGDLNNGKDARFRFPMKFPTSAGIEYNPYHQDAGKVGMYLETVYLSGENGVGGKAVITPTGIDSVNSCVMYVTVRDFKQFENKIKGNGNATKSLPSTTTTIKDVVLRGSPYGWAGILFAPNANMTGVTLDNVTIYDVYQTLALEKTATSLDGQTLQNYTYWYDYSCEGNNSQLTPKTNLPEIPLTVKNKSNLRGYTFPGKGWSQINYLETTFEQGAETVHSNSKSSPIHNLYYPDEAGDTIVQINGISEKCGIAQMQRYKVCRIDAPTYFSDCYFKAPFFIDLSHTTETVNFSNCFATSTYANLAINLEESGKKNGQQVYFIEILSDTKEGKTVVRYYGMKEGDAPSEDNYNEGFLIAEEKSS